MKTHIVLVAALLLGMAWPAQADPTAPPQGELPAAKAPVKVPLRLQAIVGPAHARVAWINNKRLVEGERIGAYRVTDIYRHSLMLEKAGTRRELLLTGSTVKVLSDTVAGR